MEIILLESIRNLGSLGDTVGVRSGYGRNYLIPQGKAVPANDENVKVFEQRRAELEAKAQSEKDAAQQRADKLGDTVITLTAKSGEEGKLFGSIGLADIVDAISAAGVAIEKRELRMPDGAIRTTGEHQIDIHLYTDIDASVTVSIVSEE